MEVHRLQLAVCKNRLDVGQGELGLVGPVLHQRYHKDHREDGEHSHRQHGPRQPPRRVPAPVGAKIGVADAVITDVIPLQKPQQQNTDNGRQQHHHGHHGAPVEIGHAAQHLVVEHRGHHIILSAHRGRNAKVSEAEEKGLDKRPCQRPQQRPEDGDPEGGQVAIPHGLGDNQRLLVNIPHGVVDQQESHRHRIDYIAQQQAAKPIDVKDLVAQQASDQALLAKGVDDGEAVGNGGKEHGQCRHRLHRPPKASGQSGVMDEVGHHKGNPHRQQRRGRRDGEAVPECCAELWGSQHRGIEFCGQSSLAPKGLDQQPDGRNGQKGCKENDQQDENERKLPMLSFHRATDYPALPAASAPKRA